MKSHRATTLPVPPSNAPRQAGKIHRITADWLARHSINVLRVSLGLVFLGFGILKFFPDASPAQALVERTLDTLTFGMVSGETALLLTAAAECFIGLTLITGKGLKAGLLVLGASLVGIMSPLVLFFTDMFPDGTPTLEAQYVFKDIVLAAAGLVIAARTLGARFVVDNPTAGVSRKQSTESQELREYTWSIK